MVDANEGYQPSYGADSQMTKVRHLIQKIFEAPDAAVYLVATGTAANSLILLPCVNLGKQYFVAQYHIFMRMSVMHQSFFRCEAHLVGDSDKINPTELRKSILAEESRGVHGPQRGPISITQITEKGQVIH